MSIFANQAGIAINNARSHEKAQALAASEERRRFARDLHDAVGQTMWTATLLSEVLPTLWDQDRRQGEIVLKKLHKLTQGAQAEMRAPLIELRPETLLEAKLADLIEQLAQAAMSH